MTFNNLQELFTIKEKLLQKKYPYNKAIFNAQKECKNAKKRNIKEYWKSVIDNYKKEITSIEKDILIIDYLYNQSLLFPKEVFIPFILECINVKEDEKYVLRNIVLSPSAHATIDNTIPSYNHFTMIFPESILEEETKLESAFYVSVLPMSYKELFEKKQVKYIMMPLEGYFQVVTPELKLLRYFNDFPYLKDIGISLIERRLREPDKKIQEILNDEIENIKETEKMKLKA